MDASPLRKVVANITTFILPAMTAVRHCVRYCVFPLWLSDRQSIKGLHHRSTTITQPTHPTQPPNPTTQPNHPTQPPNPTTQPHPVKPSPLLPNMANLTGPLTLNRLPNSSDIVLVLNYPGVSSAPRECGTDSPLRFNWMIYVQDPNDWAVGTGFTVSYSSESWYFETAEYSLPYASSTVAAAVIGRLPGRGSSVTINAILSQIPMEVVDEDDADERRFTSRAWTREALRRLHDEGIIRCPNVRAMITEMTRYGEAAVQAMFDQATLHDAISSS
ncbi:hypothetical protein BDW22DRAFT_1362648 [Trametopsis cervina]|nr:hypothetical protein BDW22DRAFT_1362648 [Trametopsis cervina]